MSKIRLLLIILLSVNLVATLFILKSRQSAYPELATISQYSDSFPRLKEFFQSAAERKGGAYAFELLRRATLPAGTDIHLLGHVIGDILYKQMGKDGMLVCTRDFRNGCSHAIVVGLFFDRGEEAVGDIVEACKKAPGGGGAYTMCFHGLGHGVLAAEGYDFKKAVTTCGKAAPEGFISREATECVGGALMELISGGDHDKTAWDRQIKRYLSSEDPLAPCNQAYVPIAAKDTCYEYITPHLFELVGSSLTNPTPEEIRRAFLYCNDLPSESSNQAACFRGFGKDLINAVLKSDIRAVTTLTNKHAQNMYDWCSLASTDFGRQQCMVSMVNSLYWGGENSEDPALVYCGVAREGDKELCYRYLLGAVSFYDTQGGASQRVCRKVPHAYTFVCEKNI